MSAKLIFNDGLAKDGIAMLLRLSPFKSIPLDNIAYLLLDKVNRRIVVALKSASIHADETVKQDVVYEYYPTETAAIHAFEELHLDRSSAGQPPLA